jgi:hypothetical protein
MKATLLAMALVGLVGCGAREEQKADPAPVAPATPLLEQKGTTATTVTSGTIGYLPSDQWTKQEQMDHTNACVGKRIDSEYAYFCACITVVLADTMPYADFNKVDYTVVMNSLETSGNMQKCIDLSKGK